MFSAESKKVYIYKDAAGKLLDAATGEAVADAARRPQRRSASTTACAARIDAALGGLTLMSPDPASGFEAAQAVFKSRDAARCRRSMRRSPRKPTRASSAR